jgi:hypothetical protein
MFDFGGFIFDGELFQPSARAARVPDLALEVMALRCIFEVNTRANFEFVVTTASLNEVVQRTITPSYLQWVLDVQETWQVRMAGAPSMTVGRARIGSVSEKDWRLIDEALGCECDGFMTMDGPLVTQAATIERKTGLNVFRPSEYWELLQPWAALYL